MLRIAERDGRLRAAKVVAECSSGRSTGIPQIVRSGGRLVLAWRHEERVLTALLDAEEAD